MLKKRTLHPPILFRHHTPTTTPELSPTTSSSDSESDEDMDSPRPRPLSLTVPPGAFCPMRPSLDEVLANTAPAPYTLSAFMAYLSQNHCLETLEFTLEAKRYRETYNALSRQLNQSPIASECPESQHLRMLWQRLLTAYIIPGSPREINVSSEVREDILRYANQTPPPPPEILDLAVKLVHDLMEESIFIPFLNAHAAAAHVFPLSEPLFPHEDVTVVSNASLDDHTVKRVRSKGRRLSPRSSKELGSPVSVGSPIGHPTRSNFSLSAMTSSLSKAGHRTSSHVTSASGESASGSALTDDSGSVQSNVSAGEPMTPPTTPPSSEPNSMQLGHSPKRSDNPWKKMGMKLGFKKRSGNSGSGSHHFKLSGMDE
ncbi:regulator of G-protein signaling domain-containing protein [Aspergillus fijiensis CBS 313.89]|uniref:Regulator of G protein signaling superfamily n=1 Tax=Aspergillus fijiensis CBS 313.89 TaxID=1448319 RepID=A0A8G1W466_9EURO|nr:regulator of G protein signaling superfamily [Aspergillus fijiensis CBS 313.89]RAK82428.1 regulator of G protein signaling superfamily [Aspergillus fijiensis CBS 313.89]